MYKRVHYQHSDHHQRESTGHADPGPSVKVSTQAIGSIKQGTGGSVLMVECKRL